MNQPEKEANKNDDFELKLLSTSETVDISPSIETTLANIIEDLKITDQTENDSVVLESDFDEKGVPIFPNDLLVKLDEMVNKTKWIIPVLPKAELESLMTAAIKLSRKELDTKSEACQRFFSEGMTISFTKVLMDDAVSTWKFEIHKCILKNTEKLIELCVVKLEQDWFPLLDLLAMALNPNSKFHLFNSARNSEFTPSHGWFARCNDCRQPKGWLVDLVNQFGDLGGFHKLKHRICDIGGLNAQIVCALIKPFGLCAEVLTEHTVEQFLLPVVKSIKCFLDSITDEILKKESKNEAISVIIKSMKLIVSCLPGQAELCKQFEELRLLMILRLLQVSPFNGKMNALNEINRVISSVSYYSNHRHNNYEEDEYLTNDMVAKWLQENNVLVIVLKDNLHQPQYVEKLEKIIRFTIKSKTLTVKDLDTIWMAQLGKHEAIVKNVHDLLAKLAWDFSAEQLDHLFSRFQAGWNSANKKQQEKLLELIRRLAEDDKEGVIAHKVLNLLWQLAHSDDLPTDIMDQALNAHIKILDYSCSQTQDRDNLKIHWIDLCVEEIKVGSWVIPALKQIRAICELFYENGNQVSNHHILYRNTVVESIQNKHAIVSLVAENLTKYMSKIHNLYQNDTSINPEELLPDRRYPHVRQIQERLDFLRFILNDGKMWLCQPQAEQIWVCLAINSVFPVDQDICFKWFSVVMGDDPDLDPDITRQFFENNVLKTDPTMLNEHGLKCFERFFKFVNLKEGYLQKKRNGAFVLEHTQLIGYDYLWKVITQASVDIVTQAIEVLREIYTNIGSQLKQSEIHSMFIKTCSDRIHPCEEIMCNTDYNTLTGKATILEQARKVTACLRALKVYVEESDKNYCIERAIPAHERSARGKQICLYVRFPQQNRQIDDFEVWSHSNESIASLRRRIYVRLKNIVQAIKLDICYNNDVLNPTDDRKLISDLPIKDRGVFTIKLGSSSNSIPSSPDSSSDTSPPPTPLCGDGPNVETEHLLPSVILSRTKFVHTLFTLGDLAMKFHLEELQNIVLNLLNICSSDVDTINNIKTLCHNSMIKGMSSLDKLFSTVTPIQALYNLEIIYALLLPAMEPLENYPISFQHSIILAGGIDSILNLFTNKTFLHGANTLIKRMAYTVLLKISKLFLTTICFAHITVVAEALHKDSGKDIAISSTQHNYAIVLQQATQHIPNTYFEFVLRSISVKLGQALGSRATKYMPDINFVKVVQKICWSAAAGDVSLHQTDNSHIHQFFEKHEELQKCASLDDSNLAKEAFEVMTIALTLCPPILETLIRDSYWHLFIVDTLLLCTSSTIRSTAAEQCFLIATKCCSLEKPLKFFIQLLFTVRDTKATEHSVQSQEYFNLLCRYSLNYGRSINFQLQNATKIMEQELKWLRNVQNAYFSVESSYESTDDVLLEGHLGIIKELLQYHSIQKRYHIGCEEGGEKLIERLLNDFVFSSSRSLLAARRGVYLDQVHPMCKTQQTIVAALELLISLASNCVPNLRLIAEYLTQIYYSGYDSPITEWEYQPPIGPRPDNGFVGLKNAGATCYMNSVLQQLCMIPEIASGVLSVDVGHNEDDENQHEKTVTVLNIDNDVTSSSSENKELVEKNKQKERQQYNKKVLCQVQAIFGHLYGSKLQYYIPHGFWQVFRLWGEPVNLREQHDAYEFFNTLVDNIDEALKALGHNSVCSNVLGGSFADQKICKQCPHRYSRETPFTAINVDVRNHHNLIDSLEQYVKGDLLEGANAYYCERCDKKVDTVKRLCIRKLPKVLAIQLKRFDYDWERDCAVKFNDYFEFPREFDLEPFTVEGLAKLEGEIIEEDIIDQTNKTPFIADDEKEKSTIYKLVGVTVHSGQASGGHYYSYITNRSKSSGKQSWYKFDDGDVSDCNMDDEEELKNQCFGGEYMGEVFDHMMKRRQKRWWNAYLLFYERLDVASKTNRENSSSCGKLVMPSAIEKSVSQENIQFLHTKMQFSQEYFQFIRKLVLSSLPPQALSSPHKPNDPARDELHFICLQLLSKFLFTVCFHTKKNIRGPANEWYETVAVLVRQSPSLRRWFVIEVLLSRPDRIIEYLLECPVAEIRSAFGRIIILLAHLTRNDGCFSVELLNSPLEPWQVSDLDATKATISDYLMRTVIEVLHRESSENNPRHLLQYFQLFVMYAGIGPAERKQLLDLGVLLTFIRLALEEEFNNSVKYQNVESAKLYSLVSVLIRSCDVTKYMNSAIKGEQCKPNPYLDSMATTPIMEIPSDVEGMIYTSNCIKKFLEESNNSEDTIQLIKFLSWECLSFSLIALSEVLFSISYAYTYELRPFLDILLHLLLMNDSWQEQRLKSAFNGVSDDREGLFDTIQRSKSHSHKRGYQCIKAIVQLIQNCELAHQILMKSEELKGKWKSAIIWLGEELDRRAPSAYNYNNWSPPTASNENSNGYFLERSQSARFTYAKARELFDESEEEEPENEVPENEVPEHLPKQYNDEFSDNHRPLHYCGSESDAIQVPKLSSDSVVHLDISNDASLNDDESDS
ncbi:ubiquitin carboxyl-terminal hydrolase 9X isoform X4 [Hydra vulgaris]|uniref:Ubiquitin carboxyl-terminal hydrolase 9X isoform X4 n=1 Tax=Hydra vulgaris TaxID=6087 RepID=A0ABM4B640_HYDVU